MRKIRSIFIVGLLASAPLALTIYIFISLFSWFDSLFQPIVRQFFSTQAPVWGLGILMGIVFIFLVGIVAPSLLGKQLLQLLERTVEKLPFAKLVYSGTKQVFDAFSQDSFKRFSRVVLVPFPSAESYAIGFVTADYTESVVPNANFRLSVFVPTGPNPTGGYLIFVDESKAIPLRIGVDEALKIVISGGLVRSPNLRAC